MLSDDFTRFEGKIDSPTDISFIKHIKFDNNKRYLIGYGDTKVMILNLATQACTIHENNARLYKRICDVVFVSEDDSSYQCYIACLSKKLKQIATFDLAEDLRLRKECNKVNHGKTLKSMSVINFTCELDKEFQVLISHNLQQVAFANGSENLILKSKNGYHEQ